MKKAELIIDGKKLELDIIGGKYFLWKKFSTPI